MTYQNNERKFYLQVRGRVHETYPQPDTKKAKKKKKEQNLGTYGG